MKQLALCLLLGSALLSQSLLASQPLLRWQPVLGKTAFEQVKTIQGLPMPIKSAGYLDISSTEMLWHTTTPVDNMLRITPAGVSQWQQGNYVDLAGSAFVGQLMLAVMRQDQSFIQQYFHLTATSEDCTLLQPSQAPLNGIFRDITLCGAELLNQLKITELNGSNTLITLSPSADAP